MALVATEPIPASYSLRQVLTAHTGVLEAHALRVVCERTSPFVATVIVLWPEFIFVSRSVLDLRGVRVSKIPRLSWHRLIELNSIKKVTDLLDVENDRAGHLQYAVYVSSGLRDRKLIGLVMSRSQYEAYAFFQS